MNKIQVFDRGSHRQSIELDLKILDRFFNRPTDNTSLEYWRNLMRDGRPISLTLDGAWVAEVYEEPPNPIPSRERIIRVRLMGRSLHTKKADI